MTPLFTIAVAARNAAPHVGRFFGCVLAQTLDPSRFEVVFADDRSGDDTAREAAALGAKLPNFRLVETDAASGFGCGGARNAALAAATGEYLWHVDIDDTFPPDALARLAAAVADRPDAVVFPFAVERGGHGSATFPCTGLGAFALAYQPVAAWAKVVRRALAVPFRPDASCQDVDWHFRQADRCEKVAVLSGRALYVYDRTRPTISDSVERLAKMPRALEALAFGTELEDLRLDPKVVSDVLRALAALFDLRSVLKKPVVRQAWAERLVACNRNVMTGRFVD